MLGQTPERVEQAIGRLVNSLDQVRPESLSGQAIADLVAAGVIDDAVIWIIDHGFNRLSDLSSNRPPLAVDGSIAGEVAKSGRPTISDSQAYLPLSRRGQVIGVMEARPATDEVLEQLFAVAKTITNALLATVSISDVVDRHQGSDALSLPATIQRRNLPPVTYTDDEIEIGGRLEPAYDIAGDAIDYAINPEGIHFAIFDAVGHGLRATTLSTLALSMYRLLRRQSASLVETAIAVDEVVASNSRTGDFVTGILATIRPDRGIMELCNAGHHPPLRIRNGRHEYLDAFPIGLPFGLRNEGNGFTTVDSQRDDVVFLYSDGVVQARDPHKALWGETNLAAAALRHTNDGFSMTQVCRRLLDDVIGWTIDPLSDDASILGLRCVA